MQTLFWFVTQSSPMILCWNKQLKTWTNQGLFDLEKFTHRPGVHCATLQKKSGKWEKVFEKEMLLVFLEQEPYILFVTSKRPNAKNAQPYLKSEVLNLIFHSKCKWLDKAYLWLDIVHWPLSSHHYFTPYNILF